MNWEIMRRRVWKTGKGRSVTNPSDQIGEHTEKERERGERDKKREKEERERDTINLFLIRYMTSETNSQIRRQIKSPIRTQQ